MIEKNISPHQNPRQHLSQLEMQVLSSAYKILWLIWQ